MRYDNMTLRKTSLKKELFESGVSLSKYGILIASNKEAIIIISSGLYIITPWTCTGQRNKPPSGGGYQYDPSSYHYHEHPGKHRDYHRMGRGSNSDHTSSSSAVTVRPTRTGKALNTFT